MTALNEAAIKAYGSINPRNLPDAVFYMSRATLDRMLRENNLDPSKTRLTGTTMFGRPVHVDDSLPDGTISCIAETELDRVIRRALEEGRIINIMRPVYQWPANKPTPVPTLKALLRHWLKKVKR